MNPKRSVIPPTLKPTLPAFKAEWQEILLSTQPVEKQRAENAVDLAYQAIGFQPPKTKLWFSSPIKAAQSIIKTIEHEEKVWITDHILKQSETIARLYLDDEVDKKLRNRLWNAVSDDLTEERCHMVRRAITSTVLTWDKHKIALQNIGAPFVPWYNLRVLDLLMPWVTGLQIIKGQIELAKSCGWCWFSLDTAYMCERPASLSFNSNNQLHCLEQPAILWPDKSGIALWHGNLLEEEMFNNRYTLDAQTILATKNVEMRRILMEIYLEINGTQDILASFNAKILDDNPCLGLERKLVRLGRKDLYLFCTNGSKEADGRKRQFLLGLPVKQTKRENQRAPRRDITTAHEASAWTYGINPKQYEEQVRT